MNLFSLSLISDFGINDVGVKIAPLLRSSRNLASY